MKIPSCYLYYFFWNFLYFLLIRVLNSLRNYNLLYNSHFFLLSGLYLRLLSPQIRQQCGKIGQSLNSKLVFLSISLLRGSFLFESRPFHLRNRFFFNLLLWNRMRPYQNDISLARSLNIAIYWLVFLLILFFEPPHKRRRCCFRKLDGLHFRFHFCQLIAFLSNNLSCRRLLICL